MTALSQQTAAPLALLGGKPLIQETWKPFNTYGEAERAAADRVIQSGALSGFYGSWDDKFFGGREVQRFEQEWSAFFGCRHSVSVNSATSGLIAAVGAVGVEPGDEVIVSPWTMCASATAILVWNAIPVFADIEPETFNLDPEKVKAAVTERTRAIMVPDIFGHGARLDEIMEIARRHNLSVIEDASQAPAAMYRGKRVGTVADIGIFSLNCHKHIQTGEGGVCVTDNDRLAERMQLIRNHGEAVVAGKGVEDIRNIMGFNFRLGEIEAAMGTEQLKKLPDIAAAKERAGTRLTEGLKNLPGLKTPFVAPDCTHVYYVYALQLDSKALGVCRQTIHRALEAEGVPANEGYINLHTLPMYQKRLCYGGAGFPWDKRIYSGEVDYSPGSMPVAENMKAESVLTMEPCAFDFDDRQVDQIIEAFRKVWSNLDALQDYEKNGAQSA